ncbi:MAG: GNAT family N-acetyltransferase, partial [Myxococcota bacterium]
MPQASRRRARDPEGGLRVEPAGPLTADALVDFFRHHARGCYCRWWHFEGDDLSWQGRCSVEPDVNEAEARAALRRGDSSARGVVAWYPEVPGIVGWLKVSPCAAVAKLYRRRLYRTLSCFEGERSGVWTIGCMLVDPAHRRRGVARALVGRAGELARARGAAAGEAPPPRPRAPRAPAPESGRG